MTLPIVTICYFRRKRVSREGLDQVKKLQKEIDKTRKTIDELEENGDWQVRHPSFWHFGHPTESS